MSGWGEGLWGYSGWGSGDEIAANANGNPIYIKKYPFPNQPDVPENVTITVQFFGVNFDLDSSTIRIYVDDVLAYSGVTGINPAFYGRVTYSAGSTIVQLIPATGFRFSQVVRMRAQASDIVLNAVDDNWHFTIRDNALCYSGLSPLPIETALQESFGTFIELELLRTTFINAALRTQPTSINNQRNKAARAIYQLAFATELSTLQNPYGLRNEEAIGVKVCEKQTTLKIDQQLQRYRPRIDASIEEFRVLGTFKDEYLRAFHDYSDSSLYLYRVSLVANMLLFAKSKELEP